MFCPRVLEVSLVVVGWCAGTAGQDMALVSNQANPVTEVSMPDLVKICKGQTHPWPKGKPVTLFSHNPSSPEMKLVLEKDYGMSGVEARALITAANRGRENLPSLWLIPTGL